MDAYRQIKGCLQEGFAPLHLALENESHRHGGDAECSHLRLVMVSARFAGMAPLARQRLVYGCLARFMGAPLHALAMHCYAPGEWTGDAPPSPPCAGGRVL